MKTMKYFLGVIAIALMAACTNDVEPPKPPTPGGGDDNGNDTTTYVGKGTKADAYTIADVIKMNPQSTDNSTHKGVWVKGYIVGVYDNSTNPGTVVTAAPFTVNVNIMMAESATETNTTRMICIQLPAGDVRNILNLVDNSDKLGKEIMVYGDVLKYNGFPGVKSTIGYWLVDENTGYEPPTYDGIFFESFTTSQGDFTIDNVELGTLTYVWIHDASYKYMKGSAYSGGNIAAESWLTSPAIDLTEVASSATLTFEHTNYKGGDDSDCFFVKVREVGSETWENLTVPTWPNTKWGFVSSGNISLDAYAGKNIQISFVYTSTATYAGTWEIKNVLIK